MSIQHPSIARTAEQIITRRAEKRTRRAQRFAFASASSVPDSLRYPHSLKAWLASTPQDRLAHIGAVMLDRVRRDYEQEQTEAPAPAAAEAPAPVEEALASSPAPATRYVVACAAGCGTFHPASRARPVVVMCGDREQTPKKRSHSVYSDNASRYRAEPDRAEAPAPRRKAKTRRRAVCVNTRG